MSEMPPPPDARPDHITKAFADNRAAGVSLENTLSNIDLTKVRNRSEAIINKGKTTPTAPDTPIEAS
jgi:hypothetical protein